MTLELRRNFPTPFSSVHEIPQLSTPPARKVAGIESGTKLLLGTLYPDVGDHHSQLPFRSVY